MNDPLVLTVIFFAIVIMWACGALAVWLLVMGGTRGTHPTPHGNGEEWTVGGHRLPVRLHENP